MSLLRYTNRVSAFSSVTHLCFPFSISEPNMMGSCSVCSELPGLWPHYQIALAQLQEIWFRMTSSQINMFTCILKSGFSQTKMIFFFFQRHVNLVRLLSVRQHLALSFVKRKNVGERERGKREPPTVIGSSRVQIDNRQVDPTVFSFISNSRVEMLNCSGLSLYVYKMSRRRGLF